MNIIDIDVIYTDTYTDTYTDIYTDNRQQTKITETIDRNNIDNRYYTYIDLHR